MQKQTFLTAKDKFGYAEEYLFLTEKNISSDYSEDEE